MFDVLLESIRSTDSYILGWAIFTIIVWVLSLFMAGSTKNKVKEWRIRKNTSFSRHICSELSILHTIFITMITIFPLLGMYGTVRALITLDFTSGNMDALKGNFFSALTSTAWGIIFAIMFKLVNAITSNYVETQIEDAKKVSEEIAYYIQKTR